MELVVVVLAVAAFLVMRRFERRITEFEERLRHSNAAHATLRREFEALRDRLVASKEDQSAASQPGVPTKGVRSGPVESEPPGDSTVPPVPAPTSAVAALPPESGLEERFGTSWAVWVGGVALALGGLFLVGYVIEQGLFGPSVRIAMGATLAGLLIGAGEWLRRSERKLKIEAIPAAHIPSVLTAVGTVIAFGTTYAAHALYAFIGPTLAFLLLGAIGVGTMLASALHGPALAGLGLAGSYVAPLLVSSPRPNPWPVVVYLAAVAGAAYALARVRRWLWLAASAVAGAFAPGASCSLATAARWRPTGRPRLWCTR
jgi:uncharacterized membrane protein